MANDVDELSIAILAGGKSSRMGQDKALLPWGVGTLIDHVLATTAEIDGAIETLIVGDRPEYRGRGAPVVADRFPGRGPLGGIVTALTSCAGERVLTVAVDMPALSIELLSAMASLSFDGDALVPAIVPHAGTHYGEWRPETLHAIYRKRCLPALETRLRNNELKVADALEDLDVVYLDAGWVRQYDPELRSFANANTPAEFRRLADPPADHDG